jgi:hypothetical protein
LNNFACQLRAHVLDNLDHNGVDAIHAGTASRTLYRFRSC